MKITVMTVVAMSFVACTLAEATAPKRTPEEVYAAKAAKGRAIMARVHMKRTGGDVIKPGTGSGRIVIVSAQDRVALDEIKKPFPRAVQALRLNVEFSQGEAVDVTTAKAALSKANGQIGVFVVDKQGLPRLLMSPDEGWAIVNVAALATDSPDAAKLVARVRKETLRGFAYICGAANSQYKMSLMQGMPNLGNLDSVLGEIIPPDIFIRSQGYTVNFGVEPYYRTTYKKACEEGWAPSPTNEFQKAIWERVKADKERGPTNPITIPPPNQKK